MKQHHYNIILNLIITIFVSRKKNGSVEQNIFYWPIIVHRLVILKYFHEIDH